jgi:8-oxo-dGTP pyrophosphatase MutT (NUDIX family)
MHTEFYCIACRKRGFLRIGKAFVCSFCGTELFINTAAAVAGIIYDSQKRVLFTQRSKDPEAGKLDLPGGFIDYGETVEEGLRREIAEELNLFVECMRYIASFPNIYLWKGFEYHTVDLFFECTIKDFSTLRLSNEIASIVYRNPLQVLREDMSFESTWRVIDTILKAGS